jgi:hypothetical protein
MTHYILLASFVCKGIMVSQSGVQAWGASSKYTLLISCNIHTTADPTSTCIVLALMAGCQKCQPQPHDQQQTLFLSSFSFYGLTHKY